MTAVDENVCKQLRESCRDGVVSEVGASWGTMIGSLGAKLDAIKVTLDAGLANFKELFEKYHQLDRRILELEQAHRDRGSEIRKTDSWRVRIMWGVGIFAGAAIAGPILAAFGKLVANRLFGVTP